MRWQLPGGPFCSQISRYFRFVRQRLHFSEWTSKPLGARQIYYTRIIEYDLGLIDSTKIADHTLPLPVSIGSAKLSAVFSLFKACCQRFF